MGKRGKWAKRFATLANLPGKADDLLRGAAEGAERVAGGLGFALDVAEMCKGGIGQCRAVVDRVRRDGFTVKVPPLRR